MDEKFYLCPEFFAFIETVSVISFVLFGISTFMFDYSTIGKISVAIAYSILFAIMAVVKIRRRKKK